MELTVGQRLEEPHPQFSSLSFQLPLATVSSAAKGGRGRSVGQRRDAPHDKRRTCALCSADFFPSLFPSEKCSWPKNLLKKNKLILQRAKVTGPTDDATIIPGPATLSLSNHNKHHIRPFISVVVARWRPPQQLNLIPFSKQKQNAKKKRRARTSCPSCQQPSESRQCCWIAVFSPSPTGALEGVCTYGRVLFQQYAGHGLASENPLCHSPFR